jgi:biopolymer transport protein ExbD
MLSIRADGAMLVGERPVSEAGLGQAIAAATANDREQRVFLRADKSITYETIMRAMNALRAAGYVHVALVGAEGPGQ